MADGRTIVVGGGAIGLSVAYHLGRAGVGDVLLVERNRLGSGTSWHAAGIVGPLRATRNLTELARYGVGLFHRLEDETGLATGYRRTGGYWLAQTDARLVELKRLAGLGQMHDLDARVVAPRAVTEHFPHLDPGGLCGALWVAEDGQVNPVDLCMAYARGARNHGVEIREQAGVAGMTRRGGRVASVRLSTGEDIPARAVINCAGLWARELAALVDVDVPLRAVEHMYIVTEPIPGLVHPCPVVRDLDSGIYLKGDAGRLVLGMFERNARVWDPASVDAGADFLEFPEDWDHAEPMLEAGIRRVPAMAELGISRFMNGPESFTPDTRQVMGRAPGLENYYVAAGFNSIGIMSSAGVGRAMAEWVIRWRPDRELWSVDIRRFLPGDNDPDFLEDRIPESVHAQFDVHWPYRQHCTGRDRVRSPWHARLAACGAVFGAPTGWERPLWFAKDGDEREFRYSYGPQCWWPAARREAGRLMTSGAVLELSPFSKFLVEGDGALDSLQRLCTNRIDVPPGRMVYSLWLNEDGGIEGDCTLTRTAPGAWLVMTGAATRVKDFHHLRERLPTRVKVTDVTAEHAVLGVMGPESGALLGALCDVDTGQAAFPFASSRQVAIGGADVRASRISYAGERGWELMVPVEQAGSVLDAVMAEMEPRNMGFAGHFCLDGCRLEKGYVHWGHDVGPDDDPLGAGLMFAVRMNGGFDFIGRAALASKAGAPQETARRLFEVLAPEPPLLLHDEPIWRGEARVGHTTSGGIGFRTGKALCMGYVSTAGAEPDEDGWAVEVAGGRFPLRVLDRAPYDPEGSRMRT